MGMMLLPCSDHGNTFYGSLKEGREGSNGFQIDCGRFAVLPLLELVGDLLILVETAEAGAFHRRDVHEHVLGLVVRLDEAETLARVEPFHGTDRHGCSPWMMSPRAGVCGASNYPWEKPESAHLEGMPRTDRSGIRSGKYGGCGEHWQARQRGSGGGNKNGREVRLGRCSRKENAPAQVPRPHRP